MLKSFVTSLAVLGCMLGVAMAQVPRPGVVPPVKEPVRPVVEPARPLREAVQERVAATHDQQAAAFLFNCNRNEVELSKFAREHIQSDDVKEFAITLGKNHQEVCDHLRKIAGPWVPADMPAGERSVTEAARPANGAMPQFNWTTIHRQIADQDLASAKDEMKNLKAMEFDKAYLACQIGGLTRIHNELKVLSHYVSADMRNQLEGYSKTTEDQLKQARKLMTEYKAK